jgi:hypothetical protein
MQEQLDLTRMLCTRSQTIGLDVVLTPGMGEQLFEVSRNLAGQG